MNSGWLAAGAMALAIVCTTGGYLAGEADGAASCARVTAETKVTDQKQVIEVQDSYRQEEIRRNDVAASVSDQTAVVEAANVDSVGASDDVAARVREQLAIAERKFLSSGATCDTRLAQQREAAAANYRLLADLYRESDAAAGIRAKEAEDYRIAGAACEAIYDGVRNSPRD